MVCSPVIQGIPIPLGRDVPGGCSRSATKSYTTRYGRYVVYRNTPNRLQDNDKVLSVLTTQPLYVSHSSSEANC